MSNNSEGNGCTPAGCAGTLVVVGLIVAFVFGDKKLGSNLIDIAWYIIMAPFFIGLICFIIWGRK